MSRTLLTVLTVTVAALAVRVIRLERRLASQETERILQSADVDAELTALADQLGWDGW